MATRARFHVLIGSDGSGPARAAVLTATMFPWPAGAAGHAVIARRAFLGGGGADWPAGVWEALDQSLERLARETRQAMARRWPDADVVVVDQSPVDAILARARALRADVVVVGSRGHGMLGRLLLGSVSQGVVRRADVPILVVKGRPGPVGRLVVGLDGSPNARRAVRFVSRLRPPAGARATVVAAREPARTPSLGMMPAGVRAAVRRQAAALARATRRRVQRDVDAAVATLRGAGWRADGRLVEGVPLTELLAEVRRAGAGVLVLGARGTGGVERLLLGSVAEGALSRCPVSVLIVR
jgi:nucleotide-binding universal stress UspA family protein